MYAKIFKSTPCGSLIHERKKIVYQEIDEMKNLFSGNLDHEHKGYCFTHNNNNNNKKREIIESIAFY